MLMRLALLFALCLPPATVANAQTASLGEVYQRVLLDVIVPGYDGFAASTHGQGAVMRHLCENPSQQTLQAAREGFRQSASAWAGIEFLRFGPVMEENRLERVLFFPDRKGIGLRQTQALLAEEDDTALEAETLAAKSVAVQGLGALEFTLFGTGSGDLAGAEADSYRCRFALAVSANLANIASELAAGWSESGTARKSWLALGNNASDDSRLAVETLLSTQVHGLEAIRDLRLRRFVGEEGGTSRPKRALFWRSQVTLPVIARNLTFLEALFAAGMTDILPGDTRETIQGAVGFEFTQAIGAAGALEGPVDDLVKDEAKLKRLRYLDLLLGSLIERFDQQYAGAVGITAGFSFADGD